MHEARKRRRGFTLVEVGVATIIIVIVAMAGFAYYSSARVQEIKEWHEQNALYLAEREIEAWHNEGYTGFVGFTAADSTTSSDGSGNWLPYGYSFDTPDPEWNATGRYKDVELNGYPYRVRAQNIYNEGVPSSAPTNCYWHETWNNGAGDVDYFYRRVRVVIQWGEQQANNSAANEIAVETRISR